MYDKMGLEKNIWFLKLYIVYKVFFSINFYKFVFYFVNDIMIFEFVWFSVILWY